MGITLKAVTRWNISMKFFLRQTGVRFGVAVLAALLLFSELPALPVQAHANLVHSDPKAGAVLIQGPQIITLDFSEDLDPSFTGVKLYNANNQVVVNGPGEIDPANPRQLRLSLPALSNGAYSANWRARSAVDGHITYGTVGFSVGTGVPPASLLPPPGTPDPATDLPSPLDTLFRWLAYLAACVTVGSLIFDLLVWQPVQQGDDTVPGEWANGLFRKLVVTGSAGLIFATLGLLLLQASQASEGDLTQSLSELLVDRTGLFMEARIGLLVLLFFLAGRHSLSAGGGFRAGVVNTGLGAGVLLTFSMQSHAAALGSPAAILVDWIHLLCMTAWMGGLFALALFVGHYKATPSKHILTPLVSRFSRLAFVSVILLGLSGLYSAYLQVGTLPALTSTTYGRALIAKTGLFGLLFALGAVNRQILTPRLRSVFEPSIRWLQRTVRTEFTLGILVLAAVGVLTGSAPALEALKAQERLGILQSAKVSNVHMVLRVAPGFVGDDEFGVDVSDPRQGASDVPLAVLLRFTMLDHDMGTTQVVAEPSNGARYSARGSYLSMVGTWQVEVILRRAGFDDVRRDFQFTVQEDPAKPPEPNNPIQADAASVEAGRLLYQQDCLPCHGPQGKGDGPAGLALNPHPADLSVHTVPGLHTDGQLYEWITNGYAGSAMPAFSEILTDEQRWNVVNFIRTLAQK